MALSLQQRKALLPLAERYIWWKPPEACLSDPHRLLAQIMNMGDWHDVITLLELAGEDNLRDVLHSAQPGEFNPRSWNFWHLRLGLLQDSEPPPLPKRLLS